MKQEPTELRLASNRSARLSRHEAVRRARHLVHGADSDSGHESSAGSAREQAFAELPESTESSEALGGDAFKQIAEQLRRLDQQRAHLSSLLEQIDH